MPHLLLPQEQERAAEEERRRNEEFERNNREFCEQYMNDMAQREKLREKQAQSADANRLKGNNYFKAKKYDVALKYYLDALKSQPFDVKVLMNIAQAYLKTEGGQEDAMEFIARVLRLDPNHAKVKPPSVHTASYIHMSCFNYPCAFVPRPCLGKPSY